MSRFLCMGLKSISFAFFALKDKQLAQSQSKIEARASEIDLLINFERGVRDNEKALFSN